MTDAVPAPDERAVPTRADALRPYAVPAVVAAVFGAMAWSHRWLHEDGLINLRVVQNLVAGRGPVYNAGERIEAFTSPAQIALLTLGRIVTLGFVPIETVVFVVGVACSVAGLVFVMLGAMHLWGSDAPGRFTVPVGAIAFVAVPLTWDFATSGHEGSVGYLWIGLCFWALARRSREIRVDLRPPVDRPAWVLALVGSGALVRPELLLYTVSFVALWLVLHRGAKGSRVKALAWAFGPTLAYQVFRMGYYALLLPNTALAKLGGPLGARKGFHYLNSFVHPFVLWLPLILLAVLLVLLLRDADRDQRLVVAAIEVPALLHVAYLVSIGGDYVNGRLLVVPFLALVAPVSVVAVDRFTAASPSPRLRPVFIGATVVLFLWASGAATTMRPPWQVTSADFLDSRYDAREIAVRRWVGKPPRKISDYRSSFLAGPYKELILQYDEAGGDLMILDDSFQSGSILLPEGEGPVIASPTIGALGVVAGIDVRIIDRLALADPLASHMPAEGNTPGHLRRLPVPWVYGRMGLEADPDSKAAIQAQQCGGIAQILDDTSGSLGPLDIVTNFFHAPANTRLKVPKDPNDAVDTFC